MMYGWQIYLGDRLVSESNLEYKSAAEAESEGSFAINSISDCSDEYDWYDYRLVVVSC